VDRRAERRTRRFRTPVTSALERTLLGYALFGLFWGAWGGVLPAVQEHARASDGELGLALVMVGAGALATMRPTGALIDRYGPTVLPLTGVAFGVLALIPGLVTGPVALAVVLLLLGGASGAMDVAISASAVAAEADYGRPVLNLANAAFSGAVVAASLGAGFARHAGMSGAGVLAVVGVVVVGASVNFLGPVVNEPEPQLRAAAATPPRVWRRPPSTLLILGGLGMLAYLVENAWQSWGAIHLDATFAAPAVVVAAAPAVFAASAAVGRLTGNRVLARVAPAGVVAAGATIAAGGSVLGALAPNTGLALAGIALAGLGTSVCAPTLISVAGSWAGGQDEVGTAGATSTVVTLSYLGFLVGPALVGLVANATTLPTALGAVAGVAAGLGLLTPLAFRSALRSSAPEHNA
jgi:MFS family permease